MAIWLRRTTMSIVNLSLASRSPRLALVPVRYPSRHVFQILVQAELTTLLDNSSMDASDKQKTKANIEILSRIGKVSQNHAGAQSSNCVQVFLQQGDLESAEIYFQKAQDLAGWLFTSLGSHCITTLSQEAFHLL